MCEATCPEAPKALTSDPVNYPIETGIVSLVFEMKRLGIFEPCWSCEGHLGPAGDLLGEPGTRLGARDQQPQGGAQGAAENAASTRFDFSPSHGLI